MIRPLAKNGFVAAAGGRQAFRFLSILVISGVGATVTRRGQHRPPVGRASARRLRTASCRKTRRRPVNWPGNDVLRGSAA